MEESALGVSLDTPDGLVLGTDEGIILGSTDGSDYLEFTIVCGTGTWSWNRTLGSGKLVAGSFGTLGSDWVGMGCCSLG